jgi:hypothetical protein
VRQSIAGGCTKKISLIIPKNLDIRNLHGPFRTEFDTAITGDTGIADLKFRFQGHGLRRTVGVVLNKESLLVLTFPLDAGHIFFVEFHY